MKRKGLLTRRERAGTEHERTGFGPRTAVVKRTSMVEEAQARADETGRVIVVHNGAPWGANGGGQRPEQIARALEAEACVIHLNGCNPNRIQRPVTETVVASMGRFGDWLGIEAETRVLYSAFPEAALWAALGETDLRDWTLWYDCVDGWADFTATNEWYSQIREENIVRRADLVTATARSLVERMEAIGADAPVRFLPNSTLLLDQPTPDLRAEPQCDVVFVGCMNGEWIDWGLIERIAWEGYTVWLIGDPPKGGKPVHADNVEWVGRVDNAELREWLAAARVGIVPFLDRPLVHDVWPIKYADYLAAGIPTVAAHLPEIQGAPYCAVTWSDDDFMAALDRAVRTDWPREEIIREAQAHTAAARVAQASEWLTEVCGW